MIALLLAFLLSVPSDAMTSTQSNMVMITDLLETHGGTGFYVRTDNNSYILTNAHVCGRDKILNIDPEDGKKFTARVLFKDDKADLCAIESMLPHKGFKLAKFTYCSEYVIYMGYPELEPYTVQVAEKCDRVVLGGVKHGNSGSPVLNLDLEVIGVINQLFKDTEFGRLIPLETIKEFLKGK